MKTQVWLAFSFGVVFLLITMFFALVAFYLPKPPNPDVVANFLNVMQVILAISASGVAAVIPGFLNVKIQTKLGESGTSAIRASGALAVFALVFIVSPKSLALDQLNRRVGYNERLEQCMGFVSAFGSPMTGALRNCLEVARLDPDRWEAHRQIGRIRFWNGEYEQAIESYKKSVSLRTGINFDEIKQKDQVKGEVQTDFASMCWSIAMAYVGLANEPIVDPTKKVAAYRMSIAVGEMGRWFVGQSNETADLLNELTYLIAINESYIWLAEGGTPASSELASAINGFKQFLMMPNVVPQWAEYHLSCLYVQASRGSDKADYAHEARSYLIQALHHLLRNQSDKSVIQRLMMKCRLRDPEDCQPPRGTEPMICSAVFELFKDDAEIGYLVQNL